MPHPATARSGLPYDLPLNVPYEWPYNLPFGQPYNLPRRERGEAADKGSDLLDKGSEQRSTYADYFSTERSEDL